MAWKPAMEMVLKQIGKGFTQGVQSALAYHIVSAAQAALPSQTGAR